METNGSHEITAREFEYSYQDAIEGIKHWREHIGDLPHAPQAFFLHKGDLIFLINELLNLDAKALGIRCYLARNEAMQENHLLMVGVIDDDDKVKYPHGRDVYYDGVPSRIFDLSRPCPNMCDEHSKLFEAGVYKQKIALADLKQESGSPK